jgi:phenylpropionate dioxygenase-like ring-hydroxylating dioxygenase large terminal subunit
MANKELNPVQELIQNVSLPFPQARAMPKSVYTTEAFLNYELENVFKKDWFCAGRSDSLKNIGDYLTLELAGQPIMVLRDNDNKIRAQSNVCRHRMSTLLEGSGNTRSIICPYHAWTYGLNGALRGAPAMTLNENFNKKHYCLP